MNFNVLHQRSRSFMVSCCSVAQQTATTWQRVTVTRFETGGSSEPCMCQVHQLCFALRLMTIIALHVTSRQSCPCFDPDAIDGCTKARCACCGSDADHHAFTRKLQDSKFKYIIVFSYCMAGMSGIHSATILVVTCYRTTTTLTLTSTT
jgi:hypothetical protein